MPIKLFVISMALNILLLDLAIAQLQNLPKWVRGAIELPAHALSTRLKRDRSTPSQPAVEKLPILPNRPKIANLSRSVTQFGAVPDDGIDDTAAIQTAIDAIADRGGGSLMFPPGTYNISIQQQGKYLQALKLRSKIRLAASTTRGATIRLADRQGNYESMMGTAEYATPLTDFAIQGLTFDSNGQNNPVLAPEGSNGKNSPDFGDDDRALPRAVFRVYLGQRISIDRSRFTNQNAVWSVVFNGKLDNMTDVAITNSRFDNVGGNAVDFDHSSIYTQGSRMLVKKNIFASRSGSGTKGARTAIEIHGDDQTVVDNTIKGYANGINVTGAGIPVSQRQLYQNNTIEGVNNGFTLWSNIHKSSKTDRPALQNIIIRRNTININSDDWVLPALVSKNGPSAGISLDPNSDAPIQDLTIANNRINFVKAKPVDYTHDRFSSGITLWKYTHPNTPIDRLNISGNQITNSPGAGIWSNAALTGAGNSSIQNNTIVNPARSKRLTDDNSGLSQTGIYLQENSKTKNLRIQQNTIVDTLKPKHLKYGIVANSECATNCTIEQNTIESSTSTRIESHQSWGNRNRR
jgi:hypothetical protein